MEQVPRFQKKVVIGTFSLSDPMWKVIKSKSSFTVSDPMLTNVDYVLTSWGEKNDQFHRKKWYSNRSKSSWLGEPSKLKTCNEQLTG